MTGILIQPQDRSTVLGVRMLESLEPAFSNETKIIARRVDALRNQPSPASLRSEPAGAPGERTLDERLFDALARVKILTAQVAMHIELEWREKLFQQMDSLHDPEEWEPDDEPVLQSSFATFLKAILSISPERRPGLGLSNAGHLVAAWTTGRNRLTIEFLPDDRVRWVLARYQEGEPERFAGDTPVVRLVESLEPYHPEDWFLHERKNQGSA